MFNRPYSRKLEAEADQVGLQLAAKVFNTPSMKHILLKVQMDTYFIIYPVSGI